MTGTVKCNKCGTTLNEFHDIQLGKRVPCPSCGSTSRRYEESALVKIGVVTGGKMKGKHANEKRPFIEQSSGKDLYRKTGQLVDKIMVVDRDHNLYQEIITDPRTGEVIRNCIEPLSEHTGHGSAQKKPGTNTN